MILLRLWAHYWRDMQMIVKKGGERRENEMTTTVNVKPSNISETLNTHLWCLADIFELFQLVPYLTH